MNTNFGMEEGEVVQEEAQNQGIQNDDLETGIVLPFKFLENHKDKHHGDQIVNLVPDKIQVYKKDKQKEDAEKKSR